MRTSHFAAMSATGERASQRMYDASNGHANDAAPAHSSPTVAPGCPPTGGC